MGKERNKKSESKAHRKRKRERERVCEKEGEEGDLSFPRLSLRAKQSPRAP